MWNIVRDRIPPRRQAAICAQKLAVSRLQLEGAVFSDGLPLDRAVEPRRQRLQHLAARHAEQKRLVGRRQVLSVVALESDYGVGVLDEFDGPFGRFGGSVAVL